MKDPWYKNGIKFKCKGCGKCCFGFSGYVWLTSKDIEEISSFLNLSKKEFLKKYTRSIFGRISLIELPAPTYSCIFLEDKKCTIYKVRPFQCKAYPFWTNNFTSQKSFQEVQKDCMGADENGDLYSAQEIERLLDLYKKELSN
jgi:uncharacterized protein